MRALLAWAKRAKYGAVAQVIDGIRFDSGREARRYRDLLILQRAGLIADLECHPAFPIDVAAFDGAVVNCGRYTADFRYVDLTTGGEVVIEDVKSAPTKTTAYRLRKRLVEALYGVRIREI